jgi:ankyrin repeat protein
VKVLVASGANVKVSQGGESLLMKIVANGDLLTAERLVAAGADVNYRARDGQTALDIARATNNRDLEMLLVPAGAQL